MLRNLNDNNISITCLWFYLLYNRLLYRIQIKERMVEKMITSSSISHHHGICDMCNAKNIVIVMFGYTTQTTDCYCICKNCFAKYIQQIIYGFHNYNDGLID
jgi:hypothetical protein